MKQQMSGAKLVGKYVDTFQCPLCQSELRVVDMKSVVCMKKHTFDFAKQGYLNVLVRPSSKSQYNKELFAARHHIIMESNLYSPLHEAMETVITKHMVVSRTPLLIADLGCGEGSHLQKMIEKWKGSTITGVGLDIAKEGILMAAKRYGNGIWLVGDLAKLPFRNQSVQVILNILSPSNYQEFKRILDRDGLVIKVVPLPGYLQELREALYDTPDKKEDQKNKTVALFKKHFDLLDVIHLRYTKRLQGNELKQFVKMTPLSWSAKPEKIDRYIHQDAAEVTVDLAILVGKNCKEVEADNHGKSMY